MTAINQCKLFSITEVARLLGVGKDTVYALLRTGQLGFIEIGKRKKISLIEIHKFIDKNTRYESKQENDNLFDDIKVEAILYPSNHRKVKPIDGRNILENIMRNE